MFYDQIVYTHLEFRILFLVSGFEFFFSRMSRLYDILMASIRPILHLYDGSQIKSMHNLFNGIENFLTLIHTWHFAFYILLIWHGWFETEIYSSLSLIVHIISHDIQPHFSAFGKLRFGCHVCLLNVEIHWNFKEFTQTRNKRRRRRHSMWNFGCLKKCLPFRAWIVTTITVHTAPSLSV